MQSGLAAEFGARRAMLCHPSGCQYHQAHEGDQIGAKQQCSDSGRYRRIGITPPGDYLVARDDDDQGGDRHRHFEQWNDSTRSPGRRRTATQTLKCETNSRHRGSITTRAWLLEHS